MNKQLKAAKQTIVALTISAVLAMQPVMADTRTIVDQISTETESLNKTLERHNAIELDMQAAETLRSKLENQITTNSSVSEQVFTANQMIQKESSALEQAIQQFDQMLVSSRRIKGLIGELITEIENNDPSLNPDKTSASLRKLGAQQFKNMDGTLAFLESMVKEPYQQAELRHLREVTVSEIDSFTNTIHGINPLDNLKGTQRLFTALVTKLNVERKRLARKIATLTNSNFALQALETENDLNNIEQKLASTLGKYFNIGGSSQNSSELIIRRMMSNRAKQPRSASLDQEQHEANLAKLDDLIL